MVVSNAFGIFDFCWLIECFVVLGCESLLNLFCLKFFFECIFLVFQLFSVFFSRLSASRLEEDFFEFLLRFASRTLKFALVDIFHQWEAE